MRSKLLIKQTNNCTLSNHRSADVVTYNGDNDGNDNEDDRSQMENTTTDFAPLIKTAIPSHSVVMIPTNTTVNDETSKISAQQFLDIISKCEGEYRYCTNCQAVAMTTTTAEYGRLYLQNFDKFMQSNATTDDVAVTSPMTQNNVSNISDGGQNTPSYNRPHNQMRHNSNRGNRYNYGNYNSRNRRRCNFNQRRGNYHRNNHHFHQQQQQQHTNFEYKRKGFNGSSEHFPPQHNRHYGQYNNNGPGPSFY